MPKKGSLPQKQLINPISENNNPRHHAARSLICFQGLIFNSFAINGFVDHKISKRFWNRHCIYPQTTTPIG